MKKQKDILNLTRSAMFLALAFIMPFLTGQIPQIGSMLCPMHIPILLCGFFCGGFWGLAVGFLAPLIRSALFGMPVMFPVAFSMAFELAAYGGIAGIVYEKLPKKKASVFAALIGAMVTGRLVWGLVMFACMGFDSAGFGMEAFLAGAVTTAVPGIILQLIVIPAVVIAMERIK